MVYLGVHFDTHKMEMSVLVEKLAELKAEIDKWARKTDITDVITNEKPKDPEMLTLLRQFIYIVCEKKFIPVLRKISSEDNIQADHISRRFDEDAAKESFSKHGLYDMKHQTLHRKTQV